MLVGARRRRGRDGHGVAASKRSSRWRRRACRGSRRSRSTARSSAFTAIDDGDHRDRSSATCRRVQYSKADVNDALKEGARGASVGPRHRCDPRSSSSSSRWRSSSSSAPRCSCAASGGCSTSSSASSRRHVLTARLWLPQPNEPSRRAVLRIAPGRGARRVSRRSCAARGRCPASPPPRPPACCRSTAPAARRSSPSEGSRDRRSIPKMPTAQTTIGVGRLFRADGRSACSAAGRFTEQDDSNGHAGRRHHRTRSRAAAGPARIPSARVVHLGGPQAKNPWMTVVGVVNDVRTERLGGCRRVRLMYRPLKQAHEPAAVARVLKTEADPQTLAVPLARGSARGRSGPADLRRPDDGRDRRGTRRRRAASRRSCSARSRCSRSSSRPSASTASWPSWSASARARSGSASRSAPIRASVVRLVLGQALALAGARRRRRRRWPRSSSRACSPGLLFEVRSTDPLTYTTIALLLAYDRRDRGLASGAPRRLGRSDLGAARRLRVRSLQFAVCSSQFEFDTFRVNGCYL